MLNNGDLTSMYSIPNYNFYRFDKKHRKGGGSGLYLREDCSMLEIKFDVDVLFEVEINCFKITLPDVKAFLIVTVYNPMLVSVEFLENYLSLMFHVAENYDECYVKGDFNINLLSKDSSSLTCNHLCRKYNLKQQIQEPTIISNTSATLIDHIYASHDAPVVESGCLNLTSSDHKCIFLVHKHKQIKFNSKIIQYRKLNCVNWEAVKEQV